MLSYLRYIVNFVVSNETEKNNEINNRKENGINRENNQMYIPDTIIQFDPDNMTVDIETGHLILLTHLSDEN
jgi:hypothetical protein